MKNQEEIEKIIQENLDSLYYENTQTRMSDQYYERINAKIDALESILNLIRE